MTRRPQRGLGGAESGRRAPRLRPRKCPGKPASPAQPFAGDAGKTVRTEALTLTCPVTPAHQTCLCHTCSCPPASGLGRKPGPGSRCLLGAQALLLPGGLAFLRKDLVSSCPAHALLSISPDSTRPPGPLQIPHRGPGCSEGPEHRAHGVHHAPCGLPTQVPGAGICLLNLHLCLWRPRP